MFNLKVQDFERMKMHFIEIIPNVLYAAYVEYAKKHFSSWYLVKIDKHFRNHAMRGMLLMYDFINHYDRVNLPWRRNVGTLGSLSGIVLNVNYPLYTSCCMLDISRTSVHVRLIWNIPRS